jgi:hypothetical protein
VDLGLRVGGLHKKGEKCTYFHKGFHPKLACMKKQIHEMDQKLQQNNLNIASPRMPRRRSQKIRISQKEILAML